MSWIEWHLHSFLIAISAVHDDQALCGVIFLNWPDVWSVNGCHESIIHHQNPIWGRRSLFLKCAAWMSPYCFCHHMTINDLFHGANLKKSRLGRLRLVFVGRPCFSALVAPVSFLVLLPVPLKKGGTTWSHPFVPVAPETFAGYWGESTNSASMTSSCWGSLVSSSFW